MAATVAPFVPSSQRSAAPAASTTTASAAGAPSSAGQKFSFSLPASTAVAGVSAATPAFVPSGGAGGSGAGGDGEAQPSVPVVRNGTVYFVPPGGNVGPGGPSPNLGWGAPADMLLLEPVVLPAPLRNTWKSRFLPDRLYQYYQHQSAWLLAQIPPEDPRYKAIPPQFTRVFPLDVSEFTGTTGRFGYVTSVFKVTSTVDGMTYALRRVDNVRASATVAQEVVHRWKRVQVAGVIPLRQAFVEHGALFFVHDYCPGAKSLRELFLDAPGALLPESTLWSFVCQLVSMLRGVHSQGLACRCLTATHVLLTGHNRVKFGAAGVIDVLEASSKESIGELQRADVLKLGNLLLSLACRSPAAPQSPNESLEFIARTYSGELRNLIVMLLSEPMPIMKVCSIIGPQLAHELDLTIDHAASLDASLFRESENGRLLRILIKMGLINERPEFQGDPSWSETGNRYMLKLFRNFVFHQVDSSGVPVFDMGHIIESLNKLDVGDEEEVLLSSPDEQTLLVASYDDVRLCLNSTYDELRRRKTPASRSALASVTAKSSTVGSMGRGRGRGRGRGMGRGMGRGRGRGRGMGDRTRLFTAPQGVAGMPGMGGMHAGGMVYGRGQPGMGGGNMVYGVPPSGYGMPPQMAQQFEPPAGYPGMPGMAPPHAQPHMQ